MQNIPSAIQGLVVGAVCGDALGMPLEFGAPRPLNSLCREMIRGRLPAGSFTDDTEMALAVAQSLLTHSPLDAQDLVQRFTTWYQFHPPDVGIHTSKVLNLVSQGMRWQDASLRIQQDDPNSAGNGSLMRAWPIAAARHADLGLLIAESRLQSQVTHTHADCINACVFLNLVLADLIHRDQSKPPNLSLRESIANSLSKVSLGKEFELMLELAPVRQREQLQNSGWVRHTLEAALWAALNSKSFEEALVNAVNLGNDADTTGSVTGAIAGAMYGINAIPERWKDALHGEYPLHSGRLWFAKDFIQLADALQNL
jgi:ADP-ribosyl-[dinitrogen reductase] hydrolase